MGDGRSKWRRSHRPLLSSKLAQIATMDIANLHKPIDEARKYGVAREQLAILEACLKRILKHTIGANASPRPEQVRALRRLIFCKGDTLLVARTGFGKSLVFHAFSVLTSKITIQIVPLNKLGDEQLDDIRRLNGCKPCLINAESKKKESKLLEQVEEGEFTHILLGPEQASSKGFREALKRPALQERVGLVAIDEVHLVRHWEDFRPEFTMLGELRLILPQDVLWFACSATLDLETEKKVLESTGFRAVGPHMYQTQVIRTSIDRPDISICVQAMPRKYVNSFELLYFLLNESTNPTTGAAEPSAIPKTIVFIDSRSKVSNAATWLQKALLHKTSRTTSAACAQYKMGHGGSNCVQAIVQTFTAHVATFDRDARYNMFKDPDSRIRIMVATTSLGMGINVPDVERVLLWSFPATMNLGDVWQRIGRGGRGDGRTSTAYILLPYWAFDDEGKEPAVRTRQYSSQSTGKMRKSYRNFMSSDRSTLRKQATLSQSQGDFEASQPISSQLSEAESEQTDNSRTVVSTLPALSNLEQDHRPVWSKQNQKNRQKLPREWRRLINSSCHRREFMNFLGEDKSPGGIVPVSSEHCCSRCNTDLLPTFILPFQTEASNRSTSSGSKQAFALGLIDEWVSKKATEQYVNQAERFPIPAGVWMETECRRELANLYGLSQVPLDLIERLSTEVLLEKVPALQSWVFKNTEISALVKFLQQAEPVVQEKYNTHVRKKKRGNASLPEHGTREIFNTLDDSDCEHLSTSQIEDELATQVARREALKAQQIIEMRPPPPLARSTHPISTPLTDKTPSASPQPCVSPSPSCTPVTTARREPLRVIDPNTRRSLVFHNSTRSGRKRILTEKGKDSFRLDI